MVIMCCIHTCGIISRATGFIMMKLGKAAAFTVGSGILVLQLANSSGYININWDKLTRGVEKVAEQVEDSTSAKKKGLLKKVTRTQYDVQICKLNVLCPYINSPILGCHSRHGQI